MCELYIINIKFLDFLKMLEVYGRFMGRWNRLGPSISHPTVRVMKGTRMGPNASFPDKV